jgi:hypothetical protein
VKDSTAVPGWTDWQLMMAFVFPQLDMQDELDELELGARVWVYIASGGNS